MDKVYKKVCKDCGKEYETTHRNKKYCIECSEIRIKERVKREREMLKKTKAPLKKAKPSKLPNTAVRKWDMRKCKKCFYGAKLDGSIQICDYISITGHMRPCDPGAECTVFMPKEKGKKPKRATFAFGSGTSTELTGYVQDNIFRTEKRRRNRYK